MEFSCKVPGNGFSKNFGERYSTFEVIEKCIKYIWRDYSFLPLFHPARQAE